MYCPKREKEERERVSEVKERKKGKNERRVELTLVIRIGSEQLEQLDDGSGRVELEVGQSLGVAGDRDGESSSVEDDGVEEGEVVLDDWR